MTEIDKNTLESKRLEALITAGKIEDTQIIYVALGMIYIVLQKFIFTNFWFFASLLSFNFCVLGKAGVLKLNLLALRKKISVIYLKVVNEFSYVLFIIGIIFFINGLLSMYLGSV